MIGATLTIENLTGIEKSMSKISNIDKSEFFNNYYKEIIERLGEKIVQELTEAVRTENNKEILSIYNTQENWNNWEYVSLDSHALWDSLVDEANDLLYNLK